MKSSAFKWNVPKRCILPVVAPPAIIRHVLTWPHLEPFEPTSPIIQVIGGIERRPSLLICSYAQEVAEPDARREDKCRNKGQKRVDEA